MFCHGLALWLCMLLDWVDILRRVAGDRLNVITSSPSRSPTQVCTPAVRSWLTLENVYNDKKSLDSSWFIMKTERNLSILLGFWVKITRHAGPGGVKITRIFGSENNPPNYLSIKRAGYPAVSGGPGGPPRGPPVAMQNGGPGPQNWPNFGPPLPGISRAGEISPAPGGAPGGQNRGFWPFFIKIESFSWLFMHFYAIFIKIL